MKNKFKNRQKLIELANRMGLIDATVITGQQKMKTEEGALILVNNQRRFVKGILKLSIAEQDERIRQLEDAILRSEAAAKRKLEMAEQEAAKAAEQTVSEVSNDSNGV